MATKPKGLYSSYDIRIKVCQFGIFGGVNNMDSNEIWQLNTKPINVQHADEDTIVESSGNRGVGYLGVLRNVLANAYEESIERGRTKTQAEMDAVEALLVYDHEMTMQRDNPLAGAYQAVAQTSIGDLVQNIRESMEKSRTMEERGITARTILKDTVQRGNKYYANLLSNLTHEEANKLGLVVNAIALLASYKRGFNEAIDEGLERAREMEQQYEV